MINITVSINDYGSINEVFVTGHSGFADKGNDIVCAAVSILTQTFYLSALSLPGVGVELEDANDNGDYVVKVEVEVEVENESIIYELRGVSLFFMKGISAILKDYNKYISLEIKGVNYGSS